MSAYAVTSDIASLTKTSKDTIFIKPHKQYIGTELNDEKFNKLYSFYCGLLVQQYYEDLDLSWVDDERLAKEVSNE